MGVYTNGYKDVSNPLMRPSSYSSSSSSSGEEESMDSDMCSEGWSDSELEVSDHEEESPVLCCICDFSSQDSVAEVWSHMRSAHNVNCNGQFDLTDDYLRMKLVNYMRKNHQPPSSAAELNSDEWLQPVLEDDRLLFEEIGEIDMENSPNSGNIPGVSLNPAELSREELLAENAFLRAQIEDLRRLLIDEDETAPSRPRKGAGRYYTGKSFSGEPVYSAGPIGRGAPTIFRE